MPALYLTLLVIGVLLFGAVHAYAYTLLSLGAVMGGLVLLIGSIHRNNLTGALELRFIRTAPDLLIGLIGVFLLIQTIPLPSSLVAFISPQSYAVSQNAIPPGLINSSHASAHPWLSLAPYIHPVRLAGVRFLVYSLFFLGLTQVLNSRGKIETAVIVLLAVGCFEALYGIIQTYSGSEHIWWFKKLAYRHDVTGTYINRNHFAGYMEMMIILAVCYATALASRSKRQPANQPVRKRKHRSHQNGFVKRMKQFAANYLAREKKFNKRALSLFAGFLMGVGLILSASRAGILAAAGSLLCISFFLMLKRKMRRQGLIILGLFVVIGVYILAIDIEYTADRFQSLGRSLEFRGRWTATTLEMFKDFKFTGVGVGNFKYAYPRYQAADDYQLSIRNAHNDWAQFLAEAGVVGFLLLLIGLARYFHRTYQLWRMRRDPFAIALTLAPIGAMAALAIHSFFDFNLHIPANFLMLTALAAIGNSALHLKHSRVVPKMMYRQYVFPMKYKGGLIAIGALALLFWCGFTAVRHFTAEAYCNTVPNSTLNREHTPSPLEIRQALKWDSDNAAYHFKLAQALIRQRLDSESDAPTDGDVNSLRQDTITALEKGLRLNPFQAREHLRLAFEYIYWSRDQTDSRQAVVSADLSADRAAELGGGNNLYLNLQLGHYWVLRSFILEGSDPDRERVWGKAWRFYNAVLEINSGQAVQKRIETYIKRLYPDFKMVSVPQA